MDKDKPDHALLEIKGLKTYFFTDAGVVKAVDGIDLQLKHREVLGLVGESGCGKSTVSLSIMGLLHPRAKIMGGSIKFDGTELLNLPESKMKLIRGNRIAMIFQQPQSYLNPIFKVGTQVAEVSRIHNQLDKHRSWEQAVDSLHKVGIPEAERRARGYPHQFSGGMAQRAMISMALICEPELLIADEPTSALDVTIQAQILDLIRSLQAKSNSSVIFITHDLGVVAEIADRVAVMYAGKVIEETDVATLFTNPKHPYSKGLIRSMPVLGQKKERLYVIPGSVPELINLPGGCKFAPRCPERLENQMAVCTELEPELHHLDSAHRVRCWLYHDSDRHAVPAKNGLPYKVTENLIVDTPLKIGSIEHNFQFSSLEEKQKSAFNDKHELIKVEHLTKFFPCTGGLLQRVQGWVHAVEDVSFTISEGETLGLVGESGGGKTTIGRLLIRDIPATSGAVWFNNQNVLKANKTELKELRRQMQYIFQNPITSLNPRMHISDILEEGLVVHGMKNGQQRRQIIIETLQMVGLEAGILNSYPREFSGGQRQRIAIARTLALRPKFIICDEPVSALDVSIQSQVLNLLHDLQHELGLTYLFIAHNLGVVEHVSNRVAVMYLGQIVEITNRDELFLNPLHPYTQALISAIPIPDANARNKERILLKGDVMSPINPPTACRFHSRCPGAIDICALQEPELKEVSTGHEVACFLFV